MNIAHFASEFYPSVGGVQEFVRQLAAEQHTEGSHPVIITNRWPKSLPPEALFEQVPVRRYIFRVPEWNWRQWTGAAIWGISTLLKIAAFLRRQCIDVIHIQCVSSNAYYALHASRLLKLPLVATLHGELTVDDSGLFQRSRFARNLLRTILETADAITACSADTLRDAETFYGRPFDSRGKVIHNGVRMDEFRDAKPHPHPRPYLLAMGRHVRQKGFDVLLCAFAKSLRAGITTHDLLIAGDGPERRTLERLSEELGLTRRVHFIGNADRSTTARLFAGCAFFVLPSRLEPLGIVNLEAMAASKAVLASAVGGVPEIIQHERNGLLVRPEDFDALAHGISRLIIDGALRERLGKAGHELAHCFHWHDVSSQYTQVYESLRQQARVGISTP